MKKQANIEATIWRQIQNATIATLMELVLQKRHL
jgi:hypothetical protein